MNQVIKAFTGIFIIMFMMVSSTGVLGAFMRTLQAQDIHAIVIDELENSNYAKGVVEKLFTTVEERGYQLQIIFYQEDGSAITCRSAEEMIEEENIVMAKVVLEYSLQLAFFQITEPQQIVGYAR